MKYSSKSKKSGFVLTYMVIVIQAFTSMFFTRFFLDSLGSETYGLYQMIYSVAQYILILDLGISTVMVRYISEYDVLNQESKKENFAFHFAVVVMAIISVVAIIGMIINRNIENIYTSLTSDEYELSHRVFRIMIIQIIATIVTHYFNGICEAYERFTFTRILSCSQLLFNVLLTVVFIKSGMGIIGIAASNTISILLKLTVLIVYDLFVLKFKIKFHSLDFGILKAPALLMVAMLLQAVIGNVNSSVDKTILGIMVTKTDVTIYSVAASIVTLFNTLPSTISGVFQPEVTRMAVKGADSDALTLMVAKLGRLQFMLVGGFLAGFAVFGKDFICCWAGESVISAWQYVLIIMIPNSIPLIQNVCLVILNAYNKRIYRSFILVGMTVINIGLTILLIKLIGPIGAPLATGISYFIGHCILMNIYYQKRIGLNVFKMFKIIFSKTWLCILSAMLISFPLILWECNGSWIILIVKGVIFSSIYSVLLLVFGMNKYEHSLVNSVIKRIPILNKAQKEG